MSKRTHIWVKRLSQEEKAAIADACNRFIAEVLIPRFLPETHPTAFNYPIALLGKWRGDRYSFIERYRSGFPETLGEEFEVAFARLDHAGGDRFNLMWRRHTGQWWCLRTDLTLPEALTAIENEPLVQPR